MVDPTKILEQRVAKLEKQMAILTENNPHLLKEDEDVKRKIKEEKEVANKPKAASGGN